MIEHVKPNPDRAVKVRNPYRGGQPMPPDGYAVNTDLPYWFSMLRAHRGYGPDLVRVKPTRAAARKPSAEPKNDPAPPVKPAPKAAKKKEN